MSKGERVREINEREGLRRKTPIPTLQNAQLVEFRWKSSPSLPRKRSLSLSLSHFSHSQGAA